MISILILGCMGNESGFGFRQTEKTQRAVAVVNVSGASQCWNRPSKCLHQHSAIIWCASSFKHWLRQKVADGPFAVACFLLLEACSILLLEAVTLILAPVSYPAWVSCSLLLPGCTFIFDACVIFNWPLLLTYWSSLVLAWFNWPLIPCCSQVVIA